MSIGIILLMITGLLVYLGAAHRVLDRLYLTDTAALVVIASMIIGSFIDLTLSRDPLLTVNLGGALIPLILSIYVFIKADSKRERLRAIIATILTAICIYALSIVLKDFGHGQDILDPMYIFAISGGLIAYLLGRSRRAAFIAGTLGFLLYNLFIYYQVLTGEFRGQVRIGGAGVYDSIVISGVLALLLAELLGESLERLSGGPSGKGGEE